MTLHTAPAVGAAPAGRWSVAAELVRSGALSRAIRWEPAAGGCAAAAVLLAWRHDTTGSVDLLRGILLLVVLGAVFVVDDPGTRVVEAVPVPWHFRLTVRIVVALLIVGCAGTALGAFLVDDVQIGAGVGLEGVTILAVGLAVAAVAVRYAGVDEPGVGVAPTVLGFVVALAFVPSRWALMVPAGPQWSAAHLRWALVLVIAAAVIVAAARDPAARRRALSRLSPANRS
jgi:hypothetical protein